MAKGELGPKGPRALAAVPDNGGLPAPAAEPNWDGMVEAVDVARERLGRLAREEYNRGFLVDSVREACRVRPLWLPSKGIRGERPIAAPLSRSSGLMPYGPDAAKAWLTGKAQSRKIRFPMSIGRRDLGDMIASEQLVAEGGALRWKPVPGRANHLLDALCLAIAGRHFAPLRGIRRPVRLRAV